MTRLNIETNTGRIEITKIDEETRQTLEGVEFELRRQFDNQFMGRFVTDRNGRIVIEGLHQGNYILTETRTLERYILNTEQMNVFVQFNGTSSITVENEHKRGNIRIRKVDADNNRITLGNVEFDLYSVEFSRVIGTFFTDVNGEIFIEDLRIRRIYINRKNYWYMV